MTRQVTRFAQTQAYPRVSMENIGTKLLSDLGQRNPELSYVRNFTNIF